MDGPGIDRIEMNLDWIGWEWSGWDRNAKEWIEQKRKGSAHRFGGGRTPVLRSRKEKGMKRRGENRSELDGSEQKRKGALLT